MTGWLVSYSFAGLVDKMGSLNLVKKLFTYTGDSGINQNLRFALIESAFLGIIFTADPFVSVFLVRMGASSFQISLLSTMPAISGLILVMTIGRFLQSRKNILPWYTFPRIFSVSAYFLTGLAAFFFDDKALILVVLVIWGLATVPQTIIMVAFTVVMEIVSDSRHRFELMSRRWAVMAAISALLLGGIGVFLDYVPSPINYQIVFMTLSLAVIGSTAYALKMKLPDNEPSDHKLAMPVREQLKQYGVLLKDNPPFTKFILKRLFYHFGWTMAFPLYSIYYVRIVKASDTWIGLFNTISTIIVVVGYFFWLKQSRKRDNRVLLGWTTFGIALFPILIGATVRPEIIALVIGVGALFQAGMDLVFFDELMKTVPRKSNIIYVSIAQSAQYMATIAGPLIGSFLADHIGLVAALMISGVVRLIGFGLFMWSKPEPKAIQA